MLLSHIVAGLCSVVCVSAAVTSLKVDGQKQARTVPNSWIVELSDLSQYGKRSVDPHDHFEAHMKREAIPYQLSQKFDSMGLFVGASIKSDDLNLGRIQALPSVVAVYPVKLIDRPAPMDEIVSAVDGSPVNPTDTYSPHMMTGVDKLHNMGIYGAGTFIAVVDSGIDYTHPALGGGFGAGFKVAKGYDFVGDAYTGSNDAVPDSDPQDCSGHGTAVAGIIGANSNPSNFTGVAPAATLGAYRIFGCTGTSSNEMIIAAMLRAQSDGADVINLSLGFPAGWSEDVVAVVAERIVNAGTVVVAASGNSGSVGLYYADSPSTGLGVISTGSVDNVVTPAKSVVLSDGQVFRAYGNTPIQQAGSVPIVLSSPDITVADDGCSAYPDTVDFAGKVVVVRRGTCSFTVKAQNVINAGGDLILFYSNSANIAPANTADLPVQQAMLTQEDGEKLVQSVLANPSLTAKFPSGFYNFPNPETGGTSSSTSSYGPKWDNNLGVSISAPGGSILSTGLAGSYAVSSGTSESSPFISGVAALFISQNRDLSSPRLIRDILQSTSRPVPTTPGGSQLNTVAQAGAGLVDAYSAVKFQSVISPGQLALNDTDHANLVQTVTIVNAGSAAKNYRVENVPASVALTFSTNGNQPNAGPVPLVSGDASVAFSSTFVTVPAGGSIEVVCTFAPPIGLDATNLPIYSGFISIETADQSEKYSVPYLGVAASMKNDLPILDNTDYYFGTAIPALATPDDNFVTGPSTFTFTADDQPTIIYRLIGGSAKVLVTLVAPDTTFVPSIRKRTVADHKLRKMVRRADPALPASLGTLFEITYNYRNTDSNDVQIGYYQLPLSASTDSFMFQDGTKVPNGSYKVLLRGLKLFGDETVSEDYDSWLSPVITVNQA